jgi:hypothetical protein
MVRSPDFPVRRPRRQSGAGIASFCIATATVGFGVLAVALIVGTGGGREVSRAVGSFFCFVFLAIIAGLILGIIALARKGVNNVLAIWGVVLNALMVGTFVALLVIGLLMKLA